MLISVQYYNCYYYKDIKIRILLTTDNSFNADTDVVMAQMDKFDPTFSQRYMVDWEIRGQPVKILQPESHYESDKYNLFFLEVPEADVELLVNHLKAQPWCNIVAEADETYSMRGKPLYEADKFTIYKEIPRNILERPSSFTPR